ncbi:MAG: 1-acyl-sn-glycerol-3-phosphate acyltransferase, partial [Sulfurovaceae bacterium]|nr:1-acyl-sn-glycerol-3-phosphate acyltransferase [Sulfurovaceae bacterium]
MNKKKLISTYSYGLFIILMIFAFSTALIPFLLSHIWSKKPRVYFQKIVQQYFRIFYKLMPLLGQVTIINREIANKYHPCIYVSSHQSSMDYTLLSTIIDDYTTTSNHPISEFPLFLKFPKNGLGIYSVPKGKLDQAN